MIWELITNMNTIILVLGLKEIFFCNGREFLD
jgi:hypothetical protein